MSQSLENQELTYEELQSEVYMLDETLKGLEHKYGQVASQLSRAEAGTRVLHAKNNGLQKQLDEAHERLATIEGMLTKDQQQQLSKEDQQHEI